MSVEVSTNGQDYSSTGVHFEYQQPVAVRALEPSRGPIEGGTFVNVTGSGFSARAALLGYVWCRFNSTSVAAAWRSATELHCIAPRHAAGVTSVEVTQNEQQYTSDGVRFEFEVVAAYSVYPNSGPTAGGTLVEVRGAGIELPDARGLFCQFGGADPVAATHASRELVLCAVPPSAGGSTGAVPVRLLNNDAVYGSVVAYTYRAVVSVDRVHPVAGARGGGTLVTVYGAGFIGTTATSCRFGEVAVPARLLTAGQLECTSPLPAVVGYVSVEVSTNGQDYSSVGHLYEYMPLASVHSVEPSSGPSIGGSRVAVHGAFFSRRAYTLSYLSCKFNITHVLAYYASPSLIYCVSPDAVPGTVTLEVANTPPAFSNDHNTFEFVHVTVTSISPMSGPLTGNTLLSVSGSGFAPSFTLGLQCVFVGVLDTNAVTAGAGMIACPTPPVQHATTAVLRLRFDGSEVDTGFKFSYEPPVPVYDIEPRSGPRAGGTTVLVLGKYFTSTPAMFCRFGDMHTPTKLISSSRLTCISPPSVLASNITFELVKGTFGPSEYVDFFEYEVETSIFALTPERGPREGGTRLMLSGEGFSHRAARLGTLRCRFNATDVVAEFLSSRSVVCVTPQHTAGATAVETTANLQDYTTSGLTYHFDSVELVSVEPSHGPVRGGTLAVLAVTFTTPPLRDALTCHFGLGTTSASFDATGKVSCYTPVGPPGPTALVISSSHATFTSALQFVYDEEPTLQALHPVLGPARGGTIVAIFGSGLLSTSSMWCKFTSIGGNQVQANMVVARWVSDKLIECISPQAPVGLSSVQLSFNGHAPYSEESLVFEFNQAIYLQAVIPQRGTVAGDVPVHVFGTGYSRRASSLTYMRCKFGNISSVATLMDNGDEVICLSPRGKPGFVPLQVTNNLNDYDERSKLWYEYTIVRIAHVHPDNGPAAGGTILTITGEGFVGSPIYGSWCLFGSLSVKALVASSEKVLCETPSMVDAEAQSVELSLQLSGRTTLDYLKYHFLTTLFIENAHPLVGPVLGGTSIIVDGNHFTANSFCNFDGMVVPAQFISPARIQCSSPPHTVGSVKVAISSNNQNFFGVMDQFEYTPTADLGTIYPDRGPTDGGTFVSVFGENFHERSAELFYLSCRFNITSVPAMYISAEEVKCYAPEMPAGLVGVAVSNNLQDFAGGLTFEYVIVRLVRIEPSDGPVHGGTRVLIIGSRFTPADIYCHFSGNFAEYGTALVPGSFVSTTAIACITPPSQESGGEALLRISSNEASTDSSLYFFYLQAPELISILPSRGPTQGGTKVTVFGRGFGAALNLIGLFDMAAVHVTVLSETRLECFVPLRTAPGLAAVRVRTSSQIESYLPSEKLVFEYDAPIRVFDINPCKGPIDGGTLLSLIGTFPVSSSLHCMFNYSTSLIVSATRTSQTVVSCRTPSTRQTGLVGVEVSANMQDFSSDGSLFSFERTVLTSLMPKQGPILGGTIVTLFGVGLTFPACSPHGEKTALVDPLSCEFITGLTGIVRVAASLQSADTVVCRTPAYPGRSASDFGVSVSLSYLGASLLNGRLFVYLPSAKVSTVLPPLGPTAGGTRVTVLGSDFVEDDVMCRFHLAPSNASAVQLPIATSGISVVGRWRSPTRIDCNTPAGIAGHHAFVQVSSNGYNFSVTQAPFYYVNPITLSYIQPLHVAVEGGAIVTIHGVGFSSRASQEGLLRCAFGKAEVHASLTSATTMICETPKGLPSGFVDVEVSNNARDFTQSGLQLHLLQIELLTASPTIGPREGGTLVTIRGNSFPPGTGHDSWRCLFDGISVVATRQAESALLCASLPASHSTSASVRVALDSSTVISGLRFQYHSRQVIESIHPDHGPVIGGTILTLTGYFSQAVALCKFSGNGFNAPVPALWRSARKMECVAPRSSEIAGPTLLEVSINGAQYSVSHVPYTYLPHIELHELFPQSGPVNGGSLLVVRGQHLDLYRTQERLACTFNGTVHIPAVFASASVVHCVSPTPHGVGTVVVRMSVNGQGISTELRFEYQHVKLLGNSPTAGPIDGGTAVLVTGVRIPIGHLTCLFRDGDETLQVSASTDSSSSVICTTPPRQNARAVSLALVSHGALLSNLLTFEYYEVHAEFLSPSAGPLDGGTRVEIHGRNFHDTGPQQLFCRFGIRRRVPVLWLESTRYVCVSPPNAVSVSNVYISLNGQQYLQIPGNFSFSANPSLAMLLPARGPVLGGTYLTLIGDNLRPPAGANFVPLVRFNDIVITASRLSSGNLGCFTPPLEKGYVGVSVSSNGGLDYSSTLAFEATESRLVEATYPIHVGATGGSTVVFLPGKALYPAASGWMCNLMGHQGSHERGLFLTTTLIACRIRPMLRLAGGTARMITSGDSNNLHGATVSLHSSQNVTITPRVGPVRGGTTVSILLQVSPAMRDALFCRFGDAQVPAIHRSSQHIQCTSPNFSSASCPIDCRQTLNSLTCPDQCRNTAPSTIALEVDVVSAWKGPSQVVAKAIAAFTYVPGVIMHSIWPPHGSTSGQVLVSIRGTGFEVGMQIRFDDTVVEASVLDGSLIQCVAPRHTAGVVAVDILVNGSHDYSETSLVFTYLAATTLHAYPSSGPTHGGTVIAISGLHLFPHDLVCTMNGVALPTSFSSTTSIMCKMPPQASRGQVAVKLVAARSIIEGTALFYYEDASEVVAVFPDRGPVAGGTVMTISGNGFVETASPLCRLANSRVSLASAARWISQSMLTCTSPSVDGDSGMGFSLSISTNGVDFTPSAVQFNYYSKASVLSVHPPIGPARGGTVVTVSCVNAAALSACRFNDTITTATSVGPNTLHCNSPPSRMGLVLVEVTGNLKEFTSDAKTFEYVLDEGAMIMSPVEGPASGSTFISITGARIGEVADNLHVAFSSDARTVRVSASARSDHEVVCETPSWASAASVEVQLVSHGAMWLSPSTFHMYLDEHTNMHSIFPDHGPVEGSSSVTVSGRGFKHLHGLYCSFGSTLMPVRIIHDTRLECSSPSMNVASDASPAIPFTLTANGQDSLGAALSFTYTPTLQIDAIWPSRGAATGGTEVVLSFSTGCLNCSAALRVPAIESCAFGDALVPATYVGVSAVACVSPPGKVGDIDVALMQVTRGVAKQNAVRFEYISSRLLSVQPLSAPISGGTVVELTSTNIGSFPNDYEVICRFGEARVRAQSFVSSTILCRTPHSLPIGAIELDIFVSGARLPGTLAFFVYAEPIIENIHPALGPTNGGTLVTVSGAGFPGVLASQASCKFGSAEPVLGRQVLGHPSAIVCMSPGASASTEALSLSFNGQTFSAPLSFEYHEPLTLHRLSPLCGPISGMTDLYIDGGPIPHRALHSDLVVCRIGGIEITASLHATGMLRCIAPSSVAGYVSVEVSTNGRWGEFTSSGFVYHYRDYHDTDVIDLHPRQGPTAGGTAITLSANGCGPAMCHFSSDGDDATVVAATRLTTRLISCVTPLRSVPGFVTLQVSHSGVLGSSTAPYRYVVVPVVSGIWPTLGPPQGGTLVQVRGRNFVPSSQLRCIFGAELVPAEWLSSLHISCIAPSHRLGEFKLDVTNDGLSFAESVATTFEYSKLPQLSQIWPNNGPLSGGTMVTLHGDGFGVNTIPACRFNMSTPSSVIATVRSDGVLVCRSPRRESLAPTPRSAVEVSMTGVDYTASSLFFFEYHDEIMLDSVDPLEGPVDGGSTVVITGSGFDSVLSNMSCRFDDIITPATAFADESIRCVTPAHIEGFAKVTVGVEDFSSSYITYVFRPLPTISSVDPPFGPQSGGTMVKLRGTRFRNSHQLASLFGNTSATCRFISDSVANCTTPPHAVRVVAVRATNDGIGFSQSNVTYSFRRDAMITALVPDKGPNAGPINISIYGRNLPDRSSCLFGMSTTSSAHRISSSHVICTTPDTLATFGSVLISVTAPGTIVSGLEYTVRPPTRMTHVTPALGPTAGGTTVNVIGENFDSSAVCLFGPLMTQVFTRLIDSTQLECVVPHKASDGPFLVPVTVGSVHHPYHALGSLTFRYYTDCIISSVSPKVGSAGGGMLINVLGAGFVQDGTSSPQVYFGSTRATPGMVTKMNNATFVQTRAPAHVAGSVPISVSFNGGADLCQSSAAFFTFIAVRADRLDPISGPAAGGTRITIEGHYWSSASAILCAFGMLTARAEFISANQIQCLTPPGLIGSHRVHAIIDGRMVHANELAFEYQAVVRVSHLVPSFGLTSGGTLVSVFGSHFSARSAVQMYTRCRFNLTSVPAGYISASELSCLSPPHATNSPANALTITAGPVPIEVTNNGLDYSSDRVMFQYTDEFAVSHVAPPTGPVHGDTVIVLRGNNFVPSNRLSCLFGEMQATATFRSMNEIYCRAPPQGSGMVHVQVTLDGQKYSPSTLSSTYVYLNPIEVSHLSPANGPKVGGTIVAVHGSNFGLTREIRCRFGAIVVLANRISDSMVNCTAPSHDAGLVTVEVSQNGVDFSSSNVTFMYQDTVAVDTVVPAIVPANTQVSFQIIGQNFLPGSGCALDNYTASYTTWISANEIVCTFDGVAEMSSANVKVSSNMQDYTESTSSLQVAEPWTVITIQPDGGPVSGGTMVSVHGSGFVQGPGLVCRFGAMDVPVPAKWLSDELIECRSRARNSAGNVTLEVSINNQDFSSSGVLFEYLSTPHVGVVRPGHGPVGGGTLVEIQGGPFWERAATQGTLYCRFGDHGVSKAQRLSNSVIECVSPSHVSGAVPVEVSLNALDFTNDGMAFTYLGPSIESIHPVAGPERGGTWLTINGVNMVGGESAYCRFGGSAASPAVWISATRMQCATPPMTSGSSSMNLLTSLSAATAYGVWPFEYQAAATVVSVIPSSGPAAGGTNVMLIGTHFSSRAATLSYLRCRFNLTSAVAHFVNDSVVQCTSPAHSGDLGSLSMASVVPVEMSNNQVDFTASGVNFEYRAEVQILSVGPATGPASGGSLVTVEGEHFVAGETNCRFGVVAVPATIVSTGVAQCISPAHDDGTDQRVFVSVSTNGYDYAASRISFSYYETVQVERLDPPQGPQSGRTLIAVHGRGFLQSTSLKCRFAMITVDATFVSGTVVNCTSPSNVEGAVALEVSNNGVDFSRSNMTFNYISAVAVRLLDPPTGPEFGGSVISVLGSGMLLGSRCRFGGIASLSATLISAGELRCVSPAQPVGIYAVEVTGNMQDFTHDGIEFRYTVATVVKLAQPVLGPLVGGTVVSVHGSGFVQGPGLVCRFGAMDVPVPAKWLSDELIECRSRARNSAGNVTLEVSINNQDFSSSGVLFEYLSTPHVGVVRPGHGPVGGGTLVEIQGGPFWERAATQGTLYCRFGDHGVSKAQRLSNSVIECVSPSHVSGAVPVEVSLNALDFTNDGMAFTYLGPSIESIHPVAGPERGGTVITVNADAMPSSSTAYCLFGGARSLAQLLTSKQAVCMSPASSSGNVSLQLAFVSVMPLVISDLEENGVVSNVATFTYNPQPRVVSLIPPSGPTFGYAQVLVRGLNFQPPSGEGKTLCRFGRVDVPAEYINATALSCTSPRHTGMTVAFEVSFNGQDFTNSGVPYDFVSFAITRLEPPRGPVLGGTRIMVYLDTAPGRLDLFCRFGHADTTELVLATISSNDTRIECRSPSRPAGTVPFSVMSVDNNAITTVEFEYVNEPTVLSAVPNRALIAAMTPVYVHGEHFVNTSSLVCAFGSARSNATFISNSTIICVAPFFDGLVNDDMRVKLRVSTNMQDYSSSSVDFDFIPCPVGSFCSHLQILPCPPGGSCDSRGGSNFTECPPGTYTSAAGHATCNPCPAGFYCPSAGMNEPMICAPGMTCAYPGLAFPNAPCPAGHFCPPGVKTMDPISTTEVMRPIECPENTWCPGGVATNITQPGNLSTPQPCLAGFVCFRGSDTPHGSGPCPSGYYCPPNSLPIECSPGHYCPGVGNVFPSQCTPGFYNDKYARSFCIECPIGFICERVGLVHPTKCPAGSVCNEAGLKVPAMACPPGYFCWEGTETADWNAESDFKPYPCPKGVYCLGGITNNLTNEEDYTAPQLCPLGQFCKEASTSPFGSGRCPAGFFCPTGTSDPFPAPAGYFSRGEGNSQAVPCFAGSFSKYNPINGTNECFLCPGGFSCAAEGVIEPLPCRPGSFRKYNDTVNCQLCPEGSWNPYYANPLEALCLPCPEGRVCGTKGMTNTSQSDPCPSGYVCGARTRSDTKFDNPCPPGYTCDLETKPLHAQCAAGEVRIREREIIAEMMTSVDDPLCTELDVMGTVERTDEKRCYCPMALCPAGYICPLGTSYDLRFSIPCQARHYCPEGTSPESHAIQICPLGTTSLPGAKSIQACETESDKVTDALSTEFYDLTEDEIRTKFAKYYLDPLVYPELTCYPAPDKDAFGNSCEDIAGVDENAVRSRRLAEQNTTQSPMLFPFGDRSPPTWAVNGSGPGLSRRLSEEDSLYWSETPPPAMTFRLPAFTLARFKFNLADAGLPESMTYQDHYRISVFIWGNKYNRPFTPSFWFDQPVDENHLLSQYYKDFKDYRWSKSSDFALNLHSMQDLIFRIELQILHGLYTDKVSLFKGTMTMDILPDEDLPYFGEGEQTREPLRGDRGMAPGEDGIRNVWVAAIDKDLEVALPLNMPRLLPVVGHYKSEIEFMNRFMWKGPFDNNHGVSNLEYSMMNYTLRVPEPTVGPDGTTMPSEVIDGLDIASNGGIIMDPVDGPYNPEYDPDVYWGQELLQAPMWHLPYFSLCSRGRKIGRMPKEDNFAKPFDETPFSIGLEDEFGGTPMRARGNLVRCTCLGDAGPTFVTTCPPPERPNAQGCVTGLDVDTKPYGNLPFQKVSFSQLGAGDNMQYHLTGDFVVPPQMFYNLQLQTMSNPPKTRDPWPADAITSANLPGWDSRAPLTWVLEHPNACELIPPERTVGIGEWDVFEVKRFADVCDYVMTCMYEERSEIFAGRPYWFNTGQNALLFYISQVPIPLNHVTDGFCFPDLGPATGPLSPSAAEREEMKANCAGKEYFARIQKYFLREEFQFVRADVTHHMQEMNDGWYPHRLQLELQYWQKSSEGGKKIVKGKLIMSDFMKPETTLRGHEYDLRVTFRPVTWLVVLNTFSLGVITYLLFYIAVDFMFIFGIILLWGVTRLLTKSTAPPKLNFYKWLKGFELNPFIGFSIVIVPVGSVSLFLREVMFTFNPIGAVPGDLEYMASTRIETELIDKWLYGRIGTMLLMLGYNLMQVGANLLCPRKDKPGSIWKPGYWQRRHVLYTSVWLFIILLLTLEFSFSSFFSNNAVIFMLLFKIVWLYMEIWLLKTLTEKLVALPFEVALQTAQYVMTLGAVTFLSFVYANVVELSVMLVMRIAVNPVKFKVQRVLKFKLQQKRAQAMGQPVITNTPELEAIGLMSDMLSLMYRFSVDALGSIISPLTIVVLYLFREPFDVAKLYSMRSSELVFFMYFSFFLIPALWVMDIFIFNLLELLHSWKLFEYVQFCNERFANRSRRWVGLDNTINEELPPDLRAMDQMCLSTQFYLLGALHATGIVMTVLGYMLVLHRSHNLFRDPLVMPLSGLVSLFFRFLVRMAVKFADRFKIWYVEAEAEAEEDYDEGPGSRNKGALPPGMAAIDEGIKECIDDAFAVGYSEDTLSKLLMEAASYIPPGTSIQAANAAGGGPTVPGAGGVTLGPGQAVVSEGQLQQMLALQAQGLLPTAQGAALGGAGPAPMAAGAPGFAPGLGLPGMGGFGGMGLGGMGAPGGFAAPGSYGGSMAGPPSGFAPPGFAPPGFGSGAQPGFGGTRAAMRPPGGPPLPDGVPPPPQPGAGTNVKGDGDQAFSEFLTAFRSEMSNARAADLRKGKIVPSSKIEGQKRLEMERKANEIFGGSGVEVDDAAGGEDFDEWPDEFLLLGVAQEEAERGSSPSPESETSTTSETASTDETDEGTDDDEDAWPIEMLIG